MTERPLAEYISTRRIGEGTVTVISEGMIPYALEFSVPEAIWRPSIPEADAEGKVLLGLNLAHIAIGDASILIDPGFDDPGSPEHWPGIVRSPGMLAALAAIGVQPEAITHVLISHAHTDHFAGVAVECDGRHVARFPHARHLIGRADWEGNPQLGDPQSVLVTRLGAIERLGLLELVDGEYEVAPGVTMIATPGESPGHCIVQLRSAGQTFYYLGDLMHHRCEVEHLDWAPPWGDRAALRASREWLAARAVSAQATLIFTHDPFPAWGRIVQANSSYRWERA